MTAISSRPQCVNYVGVTSQENMLSNCQPSAMWQTHMQSQHSLLRGNWWSCFSKVENMPLIWWRHQMETFSALLAICAGNSPVTGEFLSQRPVTRSFDVFFGLRLSKCLRKQSWGWWFETPSRSLWRHCNEQPLYYACRFVIYKTFYMSAAMVFHCYNNSKWYTVCTYKSKSIYCHMPGDCCYS